MQPPPDSLKELPPNTSSSLCSAIWPSLDQVSSLTGLFLFKSLSTNSQLFENWSKSANNLTLVRFGSSTSYRPYLIEIFSRRLFPLFKFHRMQLPSIRWVLFSMSLVSTALVIKLNFRDENSVSNILSFMALCFKIFCSKIAVREEQFYFEQSMYRVPESLYKRNK
jgi:hypothetical protein